MAVLLRCPNCEKQYRWNAAKEDAPQYCPNPKCDWEDKKWADDDIVMPFIVSVKTKANDQVVRAIMDGSERRVEMAAEQAGCSVADMSALKITNLNDRKDAPIAAMPVQNEVTAHMDAMNARGAQFGFAGANAMEYSAAVQTGSAPNAGARMRTAMHEHHTAISNGVAVSDRPALETQQPGYRRRG